MQASTDHRLETTYGHLLTLWTSGVRDYHTMLSDYLTANSIFVAVIGLFDIGRPAAYWLAEVLIAAGGALVSVASLAGMHRR